MFPNDVIASQSGAIWSVFYASQSTVLTEGWQTWQKPVGASFVWGWLCGGGGGGARPPNGAASNAGGGGGPATTVTFLVPASSIPDILFIRAGKGGAGATATVGNGGTGIASYISFQPNTTSALIGVVGASGGQSNGTGGAIAAVPGSGFPHLGLILYGAEQQSFNLSAGSAGGTTNGNGGAVYYAAFYNNLSGGSGGGCGTGTGGLIVPNNSYDFPTLPLPTGGTGGNGANGFNYNKRIVFSEMPQIIMPQLVFSGGVGGAGHTTGQSGNGGNGAYGCGGGGGGSATSAGGLAGNGGNGGDGLVILGSF